ncbi:MAG: hypothetical protein ACKOES_09490, partial [Planctomycetaceae bacterium]
SSVTRRVTLDRGSRCVTIRDTIDSPVGDVRWQAGIDAEPVLEGTRVVLDKEGKAISLEVTATSDPPLVTPIAWAVADARPATPVEDQNAGFRILSCTVPRAPHVEIEVTITPRN